LRVESIKHRFDPGISVIPRPRLDAIVE